MTNETTTAHIDTLTASVQCLMIGNRQVTLSVYRQLDTVTPVQIEPFGRVRDSQDVGGGINVVGAHSTGGALVRSYVGAPRLRGGRCITTTPPADTITGLTGYAEAGRARCSCGAHPWHALILDDDGERVAWVIPNGHASWNYRDQERADAFARAEVADRRARQAIYDEWAELPLIVLAGLR